MLMMSFSVIAQEANVIPEGVYTYAVLSSYADNSQIGWAPSFNKYLDLRPAQFISDSDSLDIALQSLPETLDPLNNSSNLSSPLMYSVFEPLIEQRGDELLPALAESWEWVGMTTLEIRLRQDVVFHNGESLTADDVAFSFGPERMFNEELPSYETATELFGVIAEVEVVDEYTVHINVSRPDPDFESRLAKTEAAIMSRVAFEDAGDYATFSMKPVGTGPYSIASFDGDRVMLDGFADYWGGTPTMTTVTLTAIADSAERVDGLLSDEYQLISDVPPSQWDRINAVEDKRLILGSFNVIDFVTDVANDNSILSNPTLHEALVSMTGTKLGVFDSTSSELLTTVGGSYEYDLEVADALLAESEYSGEEIALYLVESDPMTVAVANEVIGSWQDAGVNVVLKSGLSASDRFFAQTSPYLYPPVPIWPPLDTRKAPILIGPDDYMNYSPF